MRKRGILILLSGVFLFFLIQITFAYPIIGGDKWRQNGDDSYILAGNVGIGLSSPSEKLDVAGNVSASYFIGDGSQLINLPGGSESDPFWTGNFSSKTGTGNVVFSASPTFTGTINAADLTLSGVIIAGSTPVTLTGATGYILETAITQNSLDDSEIQSNSLSAGSLATDSVSDSELDGGFGWTLDTDLNIDSNTLVVSYDDDKVGIGTASPASKLSVGGDGSSSYAIYGRGGDYGVYGSGDEYGVYGEDYSSATYGYLGHAGYGVYGHGGTYGVYGEGTYGVYGSGASYDFYAGSGNDNYFSGDVGIKDSSPDYTLDVAGTVGIDSTLTMTGSAANIALGSNYLSGDGGDEGIYVSSTGKVGIGTAGPVSSLSVGGAGSSNYAVYVSTSAYEGVHSVGYYTGVVASGSTQDFQAATGKIQFAAAPPTANTETLCWDGDGASMITDCGSSIKLKRDINEMNFDWGSYMQLRPITFFLKDPNATQDIQGGFVAEYVDEVMKDVHPELVDYKINDTGLKEPYGVDYNAVTAINTKAIQELREENEMLKSELCNRDNSYNWCS